MDRIHGYVHRILPQEAANEKVRALCEADASVVVGGEGDRETRELLLLATRTVRVEEKELAFIAVVFVEEGGEMGRPAKGLKVRRDVVLRLDVSQRGSLEVGENVVDDESERRERVDLGERLVDDEEAAGKRVEERLDMAG